MAQQSHNRKLLGHHTWADQPGRNQMKVYAHLRGSQTADAIALVGAKKFAAISQNEDADAEVSDLAS